MRSCEHLLGAPGTAKMRRWSAPVLGSEIRTPKWGPAGWFFWGPVRCQKIISASKSVRLHCVLARACILLFQADCRSQVRASANWGGPSQRDRFLCRFSAPVLGSSETGSFVARQLAASRFFSKWFVDAAVCVCYSLARCVGPDRDVASNSPAVAVGGAVARKALGLCALVGCSPYNAGNRGAQSCNAVYVHPYFLLTLWTILYVCIRPKRGKGRTVSFTSRFEARGGS